jgi:hypothetical protein
MFEATNASSVGGRAFTTMPCFYGTTLLVLECNL